MMLFTVTQLKLQAHNPELSNVLKLLEKYPHAKHLNRSTNEKFVLADLQFIFFSIMMMFTRNKTTKNTCNSDPTTMN